MTTLKEHLAQLGRKGGQARAQKLSKEERSEAARKAVTARWKKQMDLADRSISKAEKTVAEGSKKLKALVKLNRANSRKRKKVDTGGN